MVEGIEARLEMPVDPVAERLSLGLEDRGSTADHVGDEGREDGDADGERGEERGPHGPPLRPAPCALHRRDVARRDRFTSTHAREVVGERLGGLVAAVTVLLERGLHERP